MASTVAMRSVRALPHFLWRSKIAFSLTFLGKRRQMVSLTCQECCCYYFLSSLCPLAAFALCCSAQTYTEWLWAKRRKQALEQNRKYVLMQTSLIMESQWREIVQKPDMSCWKEWECTAKREYERWSLSEFTSLSIKQTSGYITVTATFSQAVGWQTSLKNKQRNNFKSIFLLSQILLFWGFFFSIRSTNQIFFLTAGSPEASNSCWNDKPFSQLKHKRPI